MKKFLTVLLALSVVFTYSFSAAGSAFAATTTDENVAKALGYVTSIHDSAKQLVADNGEQKYPTTDWKVSAANWALAYEDAYEALVDAVAKATGDSAVAILNSATSGSIDADASDREIKVALEDYLTEYSNDKQGTTYSATYAAPALKAQLAEEKAAAIAKVGAVDTSIYSTTKYTAETAVANYNWNAYEYVSGSVLTKVDDLYVAKEVADGIIDGVKTGIESITTLAADASSAAVVTSYNTLNALMNAHIAVVGDTNNNNIEDADETWSYTFVPAIKVLTIAEENASGASDAATIAAKKAQIASNIAKFKASATYLNATAGQRASYDEYLKAYEACATYLAENVKDYIVPPTTTVDSDMQITIKASKTADEYIEKAADLKAETNKDNSAKYDAEQIDKNLKAILIDVYGTGITTKTLTANAEITYVTNAEKADYKAKLAAKVDADEMKYDGTAYYDLEWKAVEAAVAEYNASVDAAKISKDVTDAQAALTKAIGKIDTAAKVLAYYTSGGKLNSAASAEFSKLKSYVGLLESEHGTTDPLVFAITDIKEASMAVTGADGTLVKFYIDNNARTAAEITALNSDAKALLAAAKTVSALKEDARKVVALVDALPAKANITVADKEAIEAAYNAYEDLNPTYRVYVSNYSKLKDAIEAVQKAEKDEILKATKNLPAVSLVTVADKTAVKEVEDMIKAYNDTEMYNTPGYTNTTVTALVAKLRSLEFDAVKAAVKAVPEAEKVAAADKEAIEAARTAYDALLSDYGDKLTSGELADLKAYEKKLVAAEKALATKLSEEKDKIIAAVESLKVTASSKAVKGKITVKWKVKGDASKIDGYQVYKSTKAQSGYKFMGKTKKLYMDNKKNIKKGKRYFYKVRAYVEIDGQKYYSDWSNKANRYAK